MASGPGQQHAEIEGGEIFLLGEPAALLDDLAVHQRDLPRRPAEGQSPICAHTLRASANVTPAVEAF